MDGEFDHSTSARAVSAGWMAPRSSPPVRPGAGGTDTARHPASDAPMAYVGYDTEGYRTVSLSGSRSRRTWGTEATSSLVPTHAATPAVGTSASPKRRTNHSAAAARSAALPTEAGYPRSVPDDASASTASGGGASHGVPTEQSTMPPGCASAALARPANRS